MMLKICLTLTGMLSGDLEVGLDVVALVAEASVEGPVQEEAV